MLGPLQPLLNLYAYIFHASLQAALTLLTLFEVSSLKLAGAAVGSLQVVMSAGVGLTGCFAGNITCCPVFLLSCRPRQPRCLHAPLQCYPCAWWEAEILTGLCVRRPGLVPRDYSCATPWRWPASRGKAEPPSQQLPD